MKRKHILYITGALIAPVALNNIIEDSIFATTDTLLNQESETITENQEGDTAKVVTTVTIKDTNLLKAINKQLGRGEVLDNVTTADMESLTTLNASNKNIESIKGLEYAVNLTNLDLNYNNISDISNIDKLVNLTRLDLSDNKISDISPIGNLVGLRHLFLDVNRISDISPLNKLNNLVELDLCNQSLEYSYEFETEDDKMDISVDNPIFGLNKEVIGNVSSISDNGTYDNDKLKWNDVIVGEHRFTYSFEQSGVVVNSARANFTGNVVVNIKITKVEKPADEKPPLDPDFVADNKEPLDPEFSVDYEEPKKPATPEKPKDEANSNTNQTSKPQTGDSSIVINLALITLALGGLVVVRKFD